MLTPKRPTEAEPLPRRTLMEASNRLPQEKGAESICRNQEGMVGEARRGEKEHFWLHSVLIWGEDKKAGEGTLALRVRDMVQKA